MSAADRLNEIDARAKDADKAGVFESDYPTWAAWEAAWDSSTDVPALVSALRAVLELADRWATQSTDYDEDTEQQIDDGKAIVRAIEEALA